MSQDSIILQFGGRVEDIVHIPLNSIFSINGEDVKQPFYYYEFLILAREFNENNKNASLKINYIDRNKKTIIYFDYGNIKK